MIEQQGMPAVARLDRRAAGLPAPPPRIVHLGLGAFHRSHQAWFTSAAADAADWGITAFTGRSPAAARPLREQEGVFTLCVRGADGDRLTAIGSLVAAEDGARLDRLASVVADPATAIVTLTVTEAGYRLDGEGRLDTGQDVVARDLELLAGAAAGELPAVVSAPARLAVALDARRRRGAGALAAVPCDNLPDNAGALRSAVLGFAAQLGPELVDWIDREVSFVSTSVDRITPATTADDLDLVEDALGRRDEAVVVAEPFADWTLSGAFPASRPRWETAGARFVDDIGPYERRKLWMLNGAHTLLASAGALRGHDTVADAIGDPLCATWIAEYWVEVRRHLGAIEAGELDRYQAALLERFANPRIRHLLSQIAQDSAAKIRYRAIPIVEAELSAGRDARASLASVALWLAANRVPPVDAARALDSPLLDEPAVQSVLAALAGRLAR